MVYAIKKIVSPLHGVLKNNELMLLDIHIQIKMSIKK